MKHKGDISTKERQVIRKLAQIIDKKGLSSHRVPNVHGWDDGKIYFWDGEKENCVSDYRELIDAITKICQEYFTLKNRKILRAKLRLAKSRAKERR
jgi:hypothetical protein